MVAGGHWIPGRGVGREDFDRTVLNLERARRIATENLLDRFVAYEEGSTGDSWDELMAEYRRLRPRVS